LKELIVHCVEAKGGHTPSDYELAKVSQEKIEELESGGEEIEEIYKLSPLQEGLLFHSVYEEGSGLYVVQLSYRLEGELDREALRMAWEEVTRRHEVLRTGYEWERAEEMLAVVRRRVEISWEEKDWRGKGEREQEEELERYLKEDRERGFDARRAPLMRQALIRLGEGRNQFVWTFHHLIMDGWSGSMLAGEVVRLYELYRNGEKVEPEGRRRYREYIKWLRKQDLKKAEQYWKRTLSGLSGPTPLGMEKPGGEGLEGGYGKRERWLSAELTEQLEKLARKEQVTLNTVTQSAWALLLSRYSGEEEVVYGVTVSGRPAELPGVETMVGLFINTLPVRVKVKGAERVGDWMRRIQADQVEMRQYEYSSLVSIQEWSGAPKGIPLFESIYAFENYPVDQTLREWKGSLQINNIDIHNKNNNPLTVAVAPGPTALLQIQYVADRIQGEDIEKMLNRFEKLLRRLAACPEDKLSDLFLILDEAEKDEELEKEQRFTEAALHRLKSKLKS
jgi:hypothetical protein